MKTSSIDNELLRCFLWLVSGHVTFGKVDDGFQLAVQLDVHLPGVDKNWGRIVFISSDSAILIPVEMIHYGFTKTAQLAISRGLAESTVGTVVTVNAVLPGPTASEGVSDFVAKLATQTNQTAVNLGGMHFVKCLGDGVHVFWRHCGFGHGPNRRPSS